MRDTSFADGNRVQAALGETFEVTGPPSRQGFRIGREPGQRAPASASRSGRSPAGTARRPGAGF